MHLIHIFVRNPPVKTAPTSVVSSFAKFGGVFFLASAFEQQAYPTRQQYSLACSPS